MSQRHAPDRRWCPDCSSIHPPAEACEAPRIHYGRWAAWCGLNLPTRHLSEDLSTVTCWVCAYGVREWQERNPGVPL